MAGQPGMEAIAHQYLVEDDERAVPAGHRLEVLEVAGGGQDAAGIGQHRLDQDRGDVVMLGEQALEVVAVVVAQQHGAQARRPPAGRHRRLLRPGSAEGHLVVPAVVPGGELGDQRAAGRLARDAAGEMHRLAAGVDEDDARQVARGAGERVCGRRLQLVREGGQRAVVERPRDGLHHGGIAMAQQGGAEAQRGFDITPALAVPEMGAVRPRHAKRHAVEVGQGPSSARYAADQVAHDAC